MSSEIGKLLIKDKKYKQALKYFHEMLIKKSNDLRTNFQLGKIYYELNDLHKSFHYFEKCNNIRSNDPNILFNFALVLQNLGKIKQAKEKYLELISLNSRDVKSYYGLFALNIENINSKHYEKLKLLVEDNNISLFEKSLINFIFSKIKKKKNNLKREIDYLELSHQLCLKANPVFNIQSNFYYDEIISKQFNKIKFKESFNPKSDFNNQKHLFIIGLPRSGSSLVETLISHNGKNIKSVGEFHGINNSILEQIKDIIYSKNFDYKNFEFKIDRNKFQNSLLEKYDILERNTFLDKSLENFFNIEIILQFFPNAKFIHTYRDYKDSVIGIYLTMLPELSWCHKIQDITNYIENYENTINYFKRKYPNKIIDVDLRKLTEKKDIETKRILEFCEIEFNKNYLDFELNENLFNKTNSFLQVREKIQIYQKDKYKSYYYLIKKK